MSTTVSIPTVNPVAAHVCGTLFNFSIDLKEEIANTFLAAAGENVQCTFDDNDYFIIHCAKDDDTTLPNFVSHLRKSIKAEQKRELDLFEDTRVSQIQGTYADARLYRSEEPAAQALEGVGVSDEASNALETGEHSSLVPSTNFLIEHETITHTWRPATKGGLINLKSRDQVLGRVGTLSNCRLECSDSAHADILIRSDNQQAVDNAISKLNVLDGATHSYLAFPYVFAYPILEGTLSALLQVTSLKDINDVRLNTTLLSSATPLFPDLRSALVVLVIQGGKSALVKQGNPQQSSIGISLWKDYPYNTFGDQLNGETEDTQIVATSTPQGTVLAEKLATPTGRWVQQDWSEYEDAFKPVVSENIQDLSLISEPPKPPTKRARAVRGAPKPTQLAPSASLNAGSTTREPLIDYRVEPQIILKNKAIDQGQKSSRNDENRQAFQVGGAPKIEPPYMPPPTNGANLVPSPGHTIPYSMTGITNGSSHSTDWEEKVVRGARGGRLVDVQGRLPAPAKDIKETMNQKSPQRLTGSQSEMVKKFEKATRQILSLALPRQGPIRFEVGIGRLLVHPQAGISEFKRPFAATEWHSAFPIKDHSNGAMRETTFTPQLTTRSLDIESILNLKQSQGRPLFKHEPCERRVTYVISCATKHNERVIIEVCENGSFKVHGSDVLVGALEWHYPLRMWDSRLQLVTQEYKLGDYHQQAQGVVKNMKVQIPADGKTINFSTTTIDQELVVQSVLLQRETAHSATTHPDLLLHLKEVQDMSVHNVPSIENHYRGSIYVPAKMISAGILWWEASFTSITAAKVLKENEALELGEVAKWSPESIVGAGVIKDMYALADEVVTKIDHVGVYNKGPYSHSDPRTGPRTRPSPGVSDLEGLPGMGNFW